MESNDALLKDQKVEHEGLVHTVDVTVYNEISNRGKTTIDGEQHKVYPYQGVESNFQWTTNFMLR